MSKIIAISQSNYIPWKGYFEMIQIVDEFVLYDDVQYTKRDWRNRNKVKTPHGLKWLTIPVSASRSLNIEEVEIADEDWNKNHWKTIRHLYSSASHFDTYADTIESMYKEAKHKKLSEINYHFLSGITELLGIDTPFSWSRDYNATGNKSERLLSICKRAGATGYVSGPAAKDYLDVDLFESQGVSVEWMEYSGYREYPQLYGDFEHSVSIIDLLFNTGKESSSFIESNNST